MPGGRGGGGVGDEYEGVDEMQGDPIKVLVKRATFACNTMGRENAEYHELVGRGRELLEIQTEEARRK